MAKENKQDRIVRQMFDHMNEHFHELKTMESNPNTKELDIERWAQSFLKTCLGYSASNEYEIRAQEQKGKLRPDLVVYFNQAPIFVVEVKKLGFDLNKSDFRCGKVQLQEYLFSLGKVPYGILCNGYEWRLYDFNNPMGVVEVLSCDVRNDDDKIEFAKKFVEDICYDFVDFHETAYRGKEWPEFAKEATAFSPESLTRAILSANVVKMISKEIRGEHEYKANIDVLFHKVYDLLVLGLNDSVKDLSDQKQAEFQKYIKSQMRQTRKVKKSKVDPQKAIETNDISTANQAEIKTVA